MKIIFEDVVIRKAEFEDASTLNRWWNDGIVMAHAGFPNGIGQTIEETQRQIKNQQNGNQLFIIEIKGEKAGECSYSIKENVAYPGWKICEETYQNRGYGTKIILYLFDFLFTKEGVKVGHNG